LCAGSCPHVCGVARVLVARPRPGVHVKSPFAQYVHRLGDSDRWIVAELQSDGSYVARLRDPEPGGLHSYESRSLLAVSHYTRVYLTRAGALRAAQRRFGGDL
jgi:hypothetical protein